MGQMAVLANRGLALSFDPSGALLSLENRATRRNYVERPGGPWKLIYSDGHCLEHEIVPEAQEPPLLEADTRRITIAYPRLLTPDGPAEITLRLTVELADDGESLWQVALENRSSITVREVWFPWIRGVRTVGGDPAADALAWPAGCGQRVPQPLARLGGDAGFRGYSLEYNRLRGLYPGPLSMQWLDLYAPDQGLYLASYDPSLQATCLYVRKHFDGEETLSLALVKYPFIGEGERWESPPSGVAAHPGDWHWGARRYRAWAHTWMQAPSPPAWVRRMPGWVCTIMKHQYGEINWDYAGISQLYNEAEEAGLDTLFLFGWYEGGHDNGYPTSYRPDPRMGGEDRLQAALAGVRARGGHAILYTQGRLLDPATSYYRAHGERLAVRTQWGLPYHESYCFWGPGTLLDVASHKQFAIACPACPEWLDQLRSQGRVVHGLGASGVLFDQIGGQPPYPCFHPDHPHQRPSLAFGEPQRRNLQALREELKAIDPEFAIVAECLTDALAGYIDITHGAWPGFQLAPDSMPELFRYTFPEHILTDRMTEREDLPEAAFAFVNGLRFNVEIDAARGSMARAPRLRAYLRALTGLQRKYARWLLEGRFVDRDGLQVENPSVAVRAYEASDSLAIVQWNPTGRPEEPACAKGRGVQVLEVTPDGQTGAAAGPLAPGAIRVAVLGSP